MNYSLSLHLHIFVVIDSRKGMEREIHGWMDRFFGYSSCNRERDFILVYIHREFYALIVHG
jgi:hypothetical protein